MVKTHGSFRGPDFPQETNPMNQGHQLTLWYFNIAIENGHLYWVFPFRMVIFHSYVTVYQRVPRSRPKVRILLQISGFQHSSKGSVAQKLLNLCEEEEEDLGQKGIWWFQDTHIHLYIYIYTYIVHIICDYQNIMEYRYH